MTVRPSYNAPHAIYSERQRIVVLTFPTVEDAELFDELDDRHALAAAVLGAAAVDRRRR